MFNAKKIATSKSFGIEEQIQIEIKDINLWMILYRL